MAVIAHIVPDLHRQSVTVDVAALLKHLPPGEFEQHVAAIGTGPPAADWHGGQLSTAAHCPIRHPFDFRPWRDLSRWLARVRPQLVHVWSPRAATYGNLAALVAGRARLVMSQPWCDGRRISAGSPWRRWLIRQADVVLVEGAAALDGYCQLGRSATHTFDLPPGIGPFQPPATSRGELLAELGLPAEARLVLAAGELRVDKHLKDLVWAADLLKVVRDDVHLLIVGDGPLAWRIDRFRRQCRIADKVHLLGARDDLPRLLAHAEQYWFGGQQLGTPRTLLEAMAAGVAVIAADTPTTRALLSHRHEGMLYPRGNRAQLTRYAQQLLNDAPRRQALAAAARQRAQHDYRQETWIERMTELYRSVADW